MMTQIITSRNYEKITFRNVDLKLRKKYNRQKF
jgi:hypothetical protein